MVASALAVHEAEAGGAFVVGGQPGEVRHGEPTMAAVAASLAFLMRVQASDQVVARQAPPHAVQLVVVDRPVAGRALQQEVWHVFGTALVTGAVLGRHGGYRPRLRLWALHW